MSEAEEFLDRVLEFYAQHEVGLSYRPKMLYVDRYSKEEPDTPAQVRKENVNIAALQDLVNSTLTKNIYKRAYNLKVSDEALKQSRDVMT